MDDQQAREVRLQHLERDEQNPSGRMGVNARTAGSPPASRGDRNRDALSPCSQASPLNSPIVKTSLTPEEHENLVAQQLLLWRQQVQLQHQHQPLTTAQNNVFAVRRCAKTISRDASASGPRAITVTAIGAGMGREQPSSELLRQVRADGGRPLGTGCGKPNLPSPSKDATETFTCSVSSEQIRQAAVESEPPARGDNDPAEPRASSQNQDPPTPATTGAALNGTPQRGILRRKGRRLGSGGSHDPEEVIPSCAGATSDQPRPSKKRVRFSCDSETEKGRTEPPPPPKRQRLVSVPLQVIRAQLELHADLQSQVHQMRIEMDRQRLEQRRISAGLMSCIKVLELKHAELSREVRGELP